MNEIRDIPLSLLDPSHYETRENVEPLETAKSLGVLQALIVRPKGKRFEVVSGHRRLATLKALGKDSAQCKVVELDDKQAARALFFENADRKDFNDYERGRFFLEYMRGTGLSEREAAKDLSTSQTTINLCVAVVRAREKVIVPTIIGPSLYENVVTANKIKEVKKLPEEKRTIALREVVENRLSTEETKTLVAKVGAGKTTEIAINEILLRRETIKPERYEERKQRVRCPTCNGTGHLLKR